MERRRSALFLDFDNIFGGLLDLDRQAALALANAPLVLIDQLSTYGLEPGAHRDLLVRRVYLNPHGSVYDEELGNESKRLYLQRFRPNLTRAGFEVVDCPPLTSAQKNAADIRIVIDVLTLLDQSTHFDEILIASSDADYTPLLLRVRSQDRRTVIITAGPAAPAYTAVADLSLDEEALIGLLRPDIEPAEVVGAEQAPIEEPSPVTPEAVAAARDLAEQLVVRTVDDADGPVNLANVGHVIHREVGSALIRSTDWFGAGSLSGFLASVSNGALRAAGDFVWNPAHHAPALAPTGLPPVIEQVSAITDMPRLDHDRWVVLFDVLTGYAATHRFNLTEATSWSRDELARRGSPVGRQSIGFVVRGAMYGGVRLDSDPPPSAERVAGGFFRALVERAGAAGLDLDHDERAELATWLGIGPPPAPE